MFVCKNSIGDAGAKALAEALSQMSGLKELDLCPNSIGDADAEALAADVEDDAAEYLAHEDDALVDELLRDPEIQRAIAPSPPPVVEAAPPSQPPQEVVEAFTTPIEEQPLDPRQLRCLLRVRSGLLNRETAHALSLIHI